MQRKLGEKSFTQESLHPLGKSPEDFWEITTQPFAEAHFAVYPEALCIRPIKAGCPKDGIILDPFCGSGTTLKVARDLGRNSIGFELQKNYVPIIMRRMKWNHATLTKNWEVINVNA